MCAAVFSPVFELHDIKQTGPLETTTRWTMTMKVGGRILLGMSFTGAQIGRASERGDELQRGIAALQVMSHQGTQVWVY